MARDPVATGDGSAMLREWAMGGVGRHRGIHVGLADDRELHQFMVIAALGLIMLNAADLLLTRHLLGLGAREGNPLMAAIIAGPIGAVIKIVVPMLLALRYITGRVYRRVALGLGIVVVFYCGVVIWNLHQMLYHYG